MAWFDVEVCAKSVSKVALAFSWEDFIGCGLREPESMKDIGGQILENDRVIFLPSHRNCGASNNLKGLCLHRPKTIS